MRACFASISPFKDLQAPWPLLVQALASLPLPTPAVSSGWLCSRLCFGCLANAWLYVDVTLPALICCFPDRLLAFVSCPRGYTVCLAISFWSVLLHHSWSMITFMPGSSLIGLVMQLLLPYLLVPKPSPARLHMPANSHCWQQIFLCH